MYRSGDEIVKGQREVEELRGFHAGLAYEKIINFLLGEEDNIQLYEQQLLQKYESVVRKK